VPKTYNKIGIFLSNLENAFFFSSGRIVWKIESQLTKVILLKLFRIQLKINNIEKVFICYLYLLVILLKIVVVSDGATDMVATASARRVNFNAKINDIGSLRTCLLWFLWNPILFMVFRGMFQDL